MNYWQNKQAKALQACNHTAQMTQKYAKEITVAISQTKIYSPDYKFNSTTLNKDPQIIFEKSTTVDAILKYGSINIIPTVLNYASFLNPGGRFIEGSSAQEESLCHSSFLFNILNAFPQFYAENALHKNSGLYQNRALYTPNIIFEDKQKANVITCAAPNLQPARRNNWNNVEDKNSLYLNSRIQFVINIAKDTNSDTLILGAFGCGVFMQNAFEVAQLFRKHLFIPTCPFNTIIFAIPDDDNYNFFYNGWNSQ